MKKLFVSFIFILCCGIIFAQTVSRSEAHRVGTNFYLHNAQSLGIEKSNLALNSESLLLTKNGNQAIYVFNFEEGGFVLVSANKSAYPVLAYSFEDVFNADDMAPATNMWIEQYLDQFDLLEQVQPETPERIIELWQDAYLNQLSQHKSGKSVAKLMTTKWNQNNPYNYYCPEHIAGPGGRVYAGCVATSMAQVMKYWNYPETGKGEAQYFWGDYFTVDFEGVEYDWEVMTNSINLASRDAIAKLMFHCGVAVDMNYSHTGSGSSINNAFFALKQNFRYRPGVYELDKWRVENDEWKFLLKEDIDKGQPIIYRGTDNGGNGHAFVCDGYQDTSYFHFNWGWGGYSDGYYFLDPINPQMSFMHGQGALLNLAPNYANYCNSMVYTQPNWSFGDGSGPNYYFNNTSCDWLISIEDHEFDFMRIYFTKFNLLENDVLTLYEGNNSSAPVIGSFTYNTIPTEIILYTNQVFITFETDAQGQADGWELTYETIALNANQFNANKISVFPNPANDIISVDGIREFTNIAIYDISGKMQVEKNVSENANIDISNLAAGVYFVRLSNNNNLETFRIIKN